MRDYEEIEASLDEIIGSGSRYFNTLNFKRDALTFVENSRGRSVRCGKKGNWIVPDMPALSSAGLRTASAKTDWVSVSENSVETPYYKAVLNVDGSFASLYDKRLCREWVKGEFNKLKIFDDRPGNYDAWDILPNYRDKEIKPALACALEYLGANGECAEFEVVHKTEKSSWRRIIRFFRQSPGIEVENIVDWHEKHKLAKAEFNCNVLSRKAVCDTSAGFIERDTHKNTSWQQARFETCCHKWCDLSETDGGIAVINDGKYGVGFDKNLISLSLLRSTIRPDITSDMGNHNFCYMIVPHSGNAVSAQINKLAFQYNVPLVKADVECDLPAFEPLYIQAVKFSENGRMIVVRLSEQNGSRGSIMLDKSVKLLNMLEDVQGETNCIEYSPFEIITIGIEI